MNIRNYFVTFWNSTPKQTYAIIGKKFFPKHFNGEFNIIRKIPRYTTVETELFGKRITIADVPSFFFMHNEIFIKKIYNFNSITDRPYIIDCGANIGLSIIYFKQLCPDAEIVGFEPDKKIFDILQKNIKSFACADVTLIEKAVWNKETEINFWNEGADGGRMTEKTEVRGSASVQTTSLRKYLNRPVDFLKIDIEGAETVVLEDCADLLHNVKNLFVEYHSFTDKKQDLERLLSILSNAGFRYYIHHIGILSANPFLEKETSVGMDMQLNIYACRF